MPMRSFFLLLSPVVLIAAMFVACSGGDSDDPATSPGPLACDGLGKKSYHYTMHIVEDVKAFEGAPPTPLNLTIPITVLWDITGANEGGDNGGSIDAKQHNELGGVGGDSETILLDNNDGYVDIGHGWRKGDNPQRPPNVPFWPIFTCRALAPDVDTSKLGPPQAETINGVPSQKFSFTNMTSDFIARHPDFVGGSQAGQNIHNLSGSVWVAEKGDLITKLDLVADGQYPTGQKISVTMQFELSDLGTDIKVRAPI
jgi:hypothetical protein